MQKLFASVLCALALSFSTQSANAQTGFLLGVLLGSAASGNNAVQGGGVTVIYTAPEDTLKSVSPMAMMTIAHRHCFHENYMNDAAGKSLQNLLDDLLTAHDQSEKRITVLQVFQLPEPSGAPCATTWFRYIAE